MSIVDTAADAVPLPESRTLDVILSAHMAAPGGDFDGYRNHAYRVANFCVAQSSRDPEHVEKIAIAAAFDDIGIWTAGTFDYLQPSVNVAREYLSRSGRAAWMSEIAEMITTHHKVSQYRRDARWLVEPFRRADWIDVSMGLVMFGVSPRCFEAVVARWPRAGFHNRLARLALRRLRTHPWNPLPMLRF
jgi:hypothetical protein